LMDVIRLDIFTDQEMQRVPEKPVRSYFKIGIAGKLWENRRKQGF